MTDEQANQIIVEAKSLGVYSGPMPDGLKAVHAEAERIRDQAVAAFKAGIRGEAVKTILSIAETEIEAPAEKNGDVIKLIEETAKKAEEINVEEIDLENDYEEGRIGVPDSTFPVPRPVERLPDLPQDFTELSTNDLRRFLSAYNAAASYAGWQLSIIENREEAAKLIGDSYFDKLIADMSIAEPKAQATALKSRANQDKDVDKWRKREFIHKAEARTLKRLLDSYERTCDRLSREWTIRSQDLQHSGN